jgi:hypothetical protein
LDRRAQGLPLLDGGRRGWSNCAVCRVESVGLVELEKLAHAAVGAPFFAGLAETGGKAAERFKGGGREVERWMIKKRRR